MYAKIYEQIFDSSIAENYQVRHVFEDLLKLADPDGVVDRTREAIARRTNVPLEIVTMAIAELEKPDPSSRSKIGDGRRIVRLDEHRDWGWQIVNHSYYRKLKSADEKRQADKERQRNNRSEKPLTGKKLQKLQNVTSVCVSESVSESFRKESEKTLYHKDTLTVLAVLNGATGSKFEEIETNLSLISARLNQPNVTLDGVTAMIKRQCELWQGTSMAEYLQPTTLFGKTKFQGYYTKRDKPVIKDNGHVSLSDMRATLRIMQDNAKELKNRNTFQDAMGVQWQDQEKRKEHNQLWREIKALEDRIQAAVVQQ